MRTPYSDPENPCKYPGYGTIDSFTYAKNAGIALRIDNVRDAAKRLASTSQAMMSANGATYRLAAYAFNYDLTQLQTLTPTTSANVSAISTSINAMTPPLMDRNNYLPTGARYTYPTSASTWTTVTLGSDSTKTNYNVRDAMTDIEMTLMKVNAGMPDPGNGATASGDTPQEVVMLVTDGVVDGSFYTNTSCTNYLSELFQQLRLVLSLPAAARYDPLHDDQEPRDQDRRSQPRLLSDARLWLLRRRRGSVHHSSLSGVEELRVDRSLFRSRYRERYFRGDDLSVREGRGRQPRISPSERGRLEPSPGGLLDRRPVKRSEISSACAAIS